MRIYFNVTDALGPSANHGITRTERRMANALADDPRVEFVAMHHGRLHRVIEPDLVRSSAGGTVTSTPSLPHLERFGLDPVPAPPNLATRVTRTVRGRLAHRARHHQRREPPRTAPLQPEPGSVVVSVGLDWVHGTTTELERLALAHGVSPVGFCYDLIPVDHPEWLFPPDPQGFLRHLQRTARCSRRMICISECTRRDFLRHLPHVDPDRVDVITLGADASPVPSADAQRFAATLFDGEPFAVYCATLDRRKNHQLLYRVMQRLARTGQPGNVLFVGAIGNGVDDLLDAMRFDPTTRGRIAHLRNCDDSHLAAVYQRATFAVYPSLYEGWGLGVTEALAHGTPCLIADNSSLPEAGLGVCETLPALAAGRWADTMSRYFREPPPPPQVTLPTWQEAAESLISVVTR